MRRRASPRAPRRQSGGAADLIVDEGGRLARLEPPLERERERAFTERVATHVDQLTWFTASRSAAPIGSLASWASGYLIDVHRHLKITDEQRERLVALYLQALDEAGLPDDEPFREAVHSHVEFGAHVAQQNSWAEGDDELHPIRHVPDWEWPSTTS
jgi:hemoglobin